MFAAVQHERATRTFIKQKSPGFLHHPHHTSHHPGLAANLTGSLHHPHSHSNPLQATAANGDVVHNLSSVTNFAGLPVNNATAALLAAHGHHSAIAGHFNAASGGNLHHQTPHLMGGGASGLLPHLSQYFSPGSSGAASNAAFTAYNPLAAHLKAAFPSMFPHLYIHTHHPSIFAPPPMIPPPPLISPPKSNITHSISSGLIKSSATKNIPSPLVAKLNEEQETADTFSNANLPKANKLESEREQHQKNQPFVDEQRINVEKESSPAVTPPFNNNNNDDDDGDDENTFLKNRINVLYPKLCSNRNSDSKKSEHCVVQKLASTIFLEKGETINKSCQENEKTCSTDIDSLNVTWNKNTHDGEGLDEEVGVPLKHSTPNDNDEHIEITKTEHPNVEDYEDNKGKICTIYLQIIYINCLIA